MAGGAGERARPAREIIGPARERARLAREIIGLAGERAWAAREPSPRAGSRAGLASERAGPAREIIGPAGEPSPLPREIIGPAGEPSPLPRETIGPAGEPSPLPRERARPAGQRACLAGDTAALPREPARLARLASGREGSFVPDLTPRAARVLDVAEGATDIFGMSQKVRPTFHGGTTSILCRSYLHLHRRHDPSRHHRFSDKYPTNRALSSGGTWAAIGPLERGNDAAGRDDESIPPRDWRRS